MKDLERMTVEEFYAEHRALWDWLAKNPEKNFKDTWPGWKDISFPVRHLCIACEFGYRISGSLSPLARCNNCLLDWGGGEDKHYVGCCIITETDIGLDLCADNEEGYFSKWSNARSKYNAHMGHKTGVSSRLLDTLKAEVVKYATIIRDLPLSAVAVKMKENGWNEGTKDEKDN